MLLDDLIHTRLAVCCASAKEYAQVDQLLKDSPDFEFPDINPVDDEEAQDNPYYFVSQDKYPMYEMHFEYLQEQYASMKREISFQDFMEGVRLEQESLPDMDMVCPNLSDVV